jgi:DTW domain-containing protein YfiP
MHIATRLLILQHPHETRHKLATVPILSRCIQPCHVIVGRRLHSNSSPLLESLATSAKIAAKSQQQRRRDVALLLFPGPDAVNLGMWFASLQQQGLCGIMAPEAERGIPAPAADVPQEDEEQNQMPPALTGPDEPSLGIEASSTGCRNLVRNQSVVTDVDRVSHNSQQQASEKSWQAPGTQITLIVLDGTWEHAKEMVKASFPYLSEFAIQVCLPYDANREGDGMGDSDFIMRKEPFGGCVSTMQAVAQALSILEEDGPRIEETLMAVLRKMVLLQASYCYCPKIRPKLKKKKSSRTQLTEPGISNSS